MSYVYVAKKCGKPERASTVRLKNSMKYTLLQNISLELVINPCIKSDTK